MENPLYIGLSRQIALQRQLDVVGNNIANMNTVGFRADRMLFAEAMMQAGDGGKGSKQVAFTIDRATYADTRAGTLTETGSPLDVAIQGDGWLRVATANGDRFTRDGRMQRDANGQIVTLGGNPVLDTGGQAIVIPIERKSVSIAPDGTVTADGEQLGKLDLVQFQNVQAMQRGADGLYATSEPPAPAADAKLAQGKIETSNVQSIVEMTRMMDLSRDYQSVSKMIEDGQDLLRSAINRLGKPQGT
jgi:flagellar basal-body rod protein FlgF